MTNYLELIKTPRSFFKSVKKETISATLKKVTLPLLVLIVVSSIMNNLLFKELFAWLNQVIPFVYIGMPIISVPISLFIMSALINLSLKILKVKTKFAQTFKSLIYPMVFIFALMILIQLVILITPIARLIIYTIAAIGIGVWSVILPAIGLSELHKIRVGKAVGAYFLSILLLIVTYIIVVISIIGGIALLIGLK